MKLGFKKALLVSSSVLLTLSVGTANYVSYSNERDSLKEAISESTAKRAKSESAKVKDFMQSIADSVHGMAEDYRQNQDYQGERFTALSLMVERVVLKFLPQGIVTIALIPTISMLMAGITAKVLRAISLLTVFGIKMPKEHLALYLPTSM